MKELFNIFLRIYDYRIVVCFILLFVGSISDLRVFPDILELSSIKKPEQVFVDLWRVIIASSSIVLTILLVAYNSLIKTFRRNSIELLSEDPWIRLLFSLYVGSFLFLSASIVFFHLLDPSAIITLLYGAHLITMGTVLFQFPLIILSLKYSSSFRRINKLLVSIDEQEIRSLYAPSYDVEGIQFIEKMEKNKLIVLKDIGLSAIGDNDWGLPQSIVSELYLRIVKPLNNKCSDAHVREHLFAIQFITNHFKIGAIRHSDLITIKVLVGYLIRTHEHVARTQIRSVKSTILVHQSQDLFRAIMDNENFYNIHPFLLSNAQQVIKRHIDSITYTDKELPTLEYTLSQTESEEIEPNNGLSDYWIWVKHDLPNIFFDPLEYAIETKNKAVYNRFNWRVHSLLDSVYEAKGLTDHQKEDLFMDYFYKASRVSKLALEHSIFQNIDVVGEHQVVKWLVQNRKYARRCLDFLTDLMVNLNKLGHLSWLQLDHYFIIGRKISSQKLDAAIKQEIVKEILDAGFRIYEDKLTKEETRTAVAYQLYWSDNFLTQENGLLQLKKEYHKKVTSIGAKYKGDSRFS